MSLFKFGSQTKILRKASSIEGLLLDKPVEVSLPKTSVISPLLDDHLYYRARAISAGDQGPVDKNGDRGYFYNGNFDFFPRKELEAAYPTFVQKNIFLDHNSESSLYSIGKILDSYPVEDPETGEFYIEILGRIDRTLHPEIARKIETGELNSTSMGCSVDESICSICAHVLHSDADSKCDHMGMNLGKKFPAEVDMLEYNIRKGEMTPCFSINRGIQFNEDSIVGVPADSTAVIKSVIANMRYRLSKKASLTSDEQVDFVKQFENLLTKVDNETSIKLKAEFCGICPPVKESSMKKNAGLEPGTKVRVKPTAPGLIQSYPATKWLTKPMEVELVDYAPNQNTLDVLDVRLPDGREESIYDFNIIYPEATFEDIEATKESSMADKNVTPNEDQKKILSKISALEMEQLESYVAHKTKKANEIVNKEVVADAASKEETFLSKIVAKVKNSFAAELLEKKIETVAKEEMKKDSEYQPKTGEPCSCKPGIARDNCPSCEGTGQMVDFKKIRETNKSAISAKFQEDKNHIMDSTWSVNEGDKCILEASLKDIWGAQFALLSFADQKWATSAAYGKEVVSRYTKEGLAKLADLWDVTHKLSKTAWQQGAEKVVAYHSELWEALVEAGWTTKTVDGNKATMLYVGKNASLKTASEPKLGPSGPRATPTTGTDNKEHNIKNTPVTKPGQEKGQTGPAAPAHQDMKTDPKFDMPGQEKGQTGPAAPKPMAVKTDYSEPKPEAEGKEVKTTPKNPDEKDAKKSEKEVETDYVAAGTEAMEAEEKGKKEEKKAGLKKAPFAVFHNAEEARDYAIGWQNWMSKQNLSYGELADWEAYFEQLAERFPELRDEFVENAIIGKKASINYKQANAQIKWSALSGEAQEFIKKHVEKHIKEDGMERAQAVAAAYSEAREKGFEVPSKASSQETIMEKKAADKPMESVDGSTLPEGKKKYDAKPEESVKGTTLPEEGKASTPETSAQGDKEHKTPDLTKKPAEAVDGTTLPPQGKKDEESVETSTHPDSKKSVGTEPDMAVKKASADIGNTGKPEESVEGTTLPAAKKTMGDKAEQSSQGDTEPKGTDPKKAIDEAVKKEAATEMPVPEMKEDVKVEEKPLDLPVDAPKVEEVSAFDATEKLDIGEGYSAHKDHESKEIIVEKDGKEVKRLPDGFGKDSAEVMKLMKAVLGLPAEEAKLPAAGPDVMAPKMDEAPKVEEHPALEEAHEDELGIKESALKVKEAELIKKEAALKAKEDAASKEEATKKFASILQARSERCRKIVAELVDKSQLSYDKAVYEAELQNGAHLLDARKKAFEASITAKMKEFMSMNDEGLSVMEATVKSLQAPVQSQTKKASRLFVSPQYNEQMSEDEEIAKIFKTMGTHNKPQ